MHARYPGYSFVNLDAMYYVANEENIHVNVKDERYILLKMNLQYDDLLSVLNNHKIDYIVHFGAQTHVDRSFDYPLDCINDNVIGTFRLLDAARRYGNVKRIIHISTDEVYGDYNEETLNEYSMLHPTNPYSATKMGSEALAMAYIHSFNLPIIITRGNNVFGPNQYPEKIIPKFIKLLNEDKPCTIHGNGTVERTFIYVDDTVNAIDTLLHKGTNGEIYNIGSYNKISIIEFTKTLIKKIKKTNDVDKWIIHVKDRMYNDKHYNINFSKIMNLGWEPKIDLETGIDMCIDHYSNK